MWQPSKLCIICDEPLTAGRILSGFPFCSSPECEATFRQHILRKLPLCGACGKPLKGPSLNWGTVRLCDSRACQLRAAQFNVPAQTVCQICGILLAPPLSHAEPTLCPSPFCQSWAATILHALDRWQTKMLKTTTTATTATTTMPHK